MPALPAYVTAHSGDDQQVVPFLVEIPAFLGNANLLNGRWTTFGRPIYARSQIWTDFAVDVQGLTAGQYDAASCTITAADGNDYIAAFDLATTKGLVGQTVNVYECWMDPATFVVQATVQKFRGKITDVTLDLAQAVMNCGPWLVFSRKDVPRWIASTTCRFGYKDSRCGYTGALPTCLKSFADCTTHANTPRFGGFRWLPKPNTKIVWTNGSWTLQAPDTVNQ